MSPIEIKELRESTKLNQTKFAQLLGVSPSTIAYWEKGIRNPPQIYVASMMKLREKLENSSDKDLMINQLLGFLLIGGIIAFLGWVFSDKK